MRKAELTSTQLRDLRVFNLILDHNDWIDLNDTEKRMDMGENVNPEGLRETYSAHVVLQARFHAPKYDQSADYGYQVRRTRAIPFSI